MIIDPADLERGDLNNVVNGLVYPRPIAWVSTVSPDGVRNLAPFSFFNAFCFHPTPVVAIGPGSRQGINKDTLHNARETGEFVVNLVSAELAEKANICSGEYEPGVDEWDYAGVTPAPSVDVRPERVAESPASFECRVKEIVELGSDEAQSNALVIGLVSRIHVDDTAMDGLMPKPEELDLVGRLGGSLWSTTRDRFSLPRPASRDPEENRVDPPQANGLS
jgi:flavin reductase (DIM6/NTAB) family NADH-FMN oxidoreductase RutF